MKDYKLNLREDGSICVATAVVEAIVTTRRGTNSTDGFPYNDTKYVVQSVVDGRLWKESKSAKTEDAFLNTVETMIRETKEHLYMLANTKQEKTFEQKLAALFEPEIRNGNGEDLHALTT